MFIPAYASAVCLEFYLDKDGQIHPAKCNSDRPEVLCRQLNKETYWNGKACVIPKVIKDCKSQGGYWKQVQLRVPGESDKGRNFINMCICPNKEVWDGKKCRSDIPISQQCTDLLGEGVIRMTKEVYGSKNCPPIPQ